MKFLKKSDNYVVMHNKEQASKELLKDNRVKKVIATRCSLIIYTKPFQPLYTVDNKLNIAPMGEYIIKLIERKFRGLKVIIKRKPGVIYREGCHHVHIETTNGAKICWGNAETSMSLMKSHNDWYWAGKTALEMLDDFKDRGIDNSLLVLYLIHAQLQYNKCNKLRNKLKDLYNKYKEDYGCSNFRNECIKKLLNKDWEK